MHNGHNRRVSRGYAPIHDVSVCVYLVLRTILTVSLPPIPYSARCHFLAGNTLRKLRYLLEMVSTMSATLPIAGIRANM